jgi:hypothetical protein
MKELEVSSLKHILLQVKNHFITFLPIRGLAAGGRGEAEVPGEQVREGDGGAGGEARLHPGNQDQTLSQPLQEALLSTIFSSIFVVIDRHTLKISCT